jgi:hypothetical protein
MHTIIDSNDTFKKYDFSSIITEDDNWQAMFVIKDIIDSGNYFENSPKFQTKENIFARKEPVWLKYRMSFLMSVFMYLGHEVKVSNMMAWSFMTNTDTQENRDSYWHHHDKHGGNSISGIYYLHIPTDVEDRDTCGTEMAPNGPEGDGKFFVRPTEYSWLIYPSNQWHRPGIAQSKDYRFILAADIQYV